MLNHLIGSSTPILFSRRSDSGKCHSPLSGSSPLVFFSPLAQIPAETRLSIHDSPFFARDQDTVGTFPAPPDPTGKVYCPLPPHPTPPPQFLALLITRLSHTLSAPPPRLVQQSSASAVRVFSIMNNFFTNQQDAALEQTVEASVMLCYNQNQSNKLVVV